MMGAIERLLAFRYVRARRREGFVSVITWFSFLGIMLGVATLIIVMAVMNGFRHELLSRILGINGHLRLYPAVTRTLHDDSGLYKKLLSIDGVTQAVPIIERQAMLTVPGGATAVMVHGIEPKDLKARALIANNIMAGRLDDIKDDGDIAIGVRMAERMGLDVGATVTIISPETLATAFGPSPRMRSFKVRAIFKVGMSEYDNLFAFVPLAGAKKFFRLPENSVSHIEIFTNDPSHVERFLPQIMDVIPPEIGVLDWQRANSSYFEAIHVERNVMFLILTLIILVAAFNIISSLIMLVKDKTADIAILRTMGASRASIMAVFVAIGGMIGVIGTSFGAFLGISFAANIESIRTWLQGLTGTDLFRAEIYFLSKLPAIIDFHEVIGVVAMSLSLSFLATLYPAWRAAKLDPVEALRYG